MGIVFSSILATLVTIPLLGYLIIFIVSKQITKQHRRSVNIALDVSTLLFIISVHFLVIAIWDQSYLWIIFLSMLVTAIFFVCMNWRFRQEINFRRIIRGFWRFNFLIFFTAYVVLILIGLVQRVTDVILIP